MWSPLALLALMWVIRLADFVLPGTFNGVAQHAWRLSTLPGIFASPLLHSGWPHLLANTVPFLILGCLVALGGTLRFWFVTLIVTVTAGLGAFFLSPPGTVTVGASGLIFGYFAYLLVAAFFADGWGRRFAYAGVAIAVVLVFGASMLTGFFPQAGISWQAHLFGAVGGVLAASLMRPHTSATTKPTAALDF